MSFEEKVLGLRFPQPVGRESAAPPALPVASSLLCDHHSPSNLILNSLFPLLPVRESGFGSQ
jgi:hypothetical protein